jgi:25S rRNA (adenine2142-N1)-methyltransferase
MALSRKNKRKSLSTGRPPQFNASVALSSKATRTLIRTHHTLQKQRSKALAEGNDAVAVEIAHQIERQGGIGTYQRASLLGQKNDRGGDSSKQLMDWIKPLVSSLRQKEDGSRLRMLEVGALSTGNACSRSGLFDMERIDLNSQAEGIAQQDFMERPLPTNETSRFDIISLSLVLNYVPDPLSRGEMLKRTLDFLRQPLGGAPSDVLESFPSLFLVLPLSCITNSRYMNEARLEAIMSSLGYAKLNQKLSNKLVYYLWHATNLVPKKQSKSFKKTEIRAGGSRNNFAIVLK